MKERIMAGEASQIFHGLMLYKNECQSWRNKIKRAEHAKGFPADRLLKMHEAFKKETLQRKKHVKEHKMLPQEERLKKAQ